MVRYKIIGKTGADDNRGDGYTGRKVREEAEGWMEWDDDVLIVPMSGPWRSTDPAAARYRNDRRNRNLRAQFGPASLRKE